MLNQSNYVFYNHSSIKTEVSSSNDKIAKISESHSSVEQAI